jgi:hypothetical protein
MDIFTWSIPFVVEKITDMLFNVMKHGEKAAETEDMEIPKSALLDEEAEEKKLRLNNIKNKVKALGRMRLKNLR